MAQKYLFIAILCAKMSRLNRALKLQRNKQFYLLCIRPWHWCIRIRAQLLSLDPRYPATWLSTLSFRIPYHLNNKEKSLEVCAGKGKNIKTIIAKKNYHDWQIMTLVIMLLFGVSCEAFLKQATFLRAAFHFRNWLQPESK
jgi:hypothetical protein